MARKPVSNSRIVVLVLLIAALAVAIYFLWQSRTGGPAEQLRTIQVRTDQAPGDTRERVLQLMGEPDDESDTFPLFGESRLAGNAARTDAVTWLLWEGRGVKCVVGLDTTSHVVYAGHTGR